MMAPKHSTNERRELAVFADALREMLDLEPIYQHDRSKNQTEKYRIYTMKIQSGMKMKQGNCS